MTGFEDLPYRPCVGLAVINAAGRVFIGRRSSGPEHIDETHVWQMPQGGIDRGEDPWPAALRELYEETGVRSVTVLAQSRDWIYYDLPLEAVGKALKGKYRGQRQRWFAMRFIGGEEEINLQPDGHKPEFDSWRWADPSEVLGRIVGFKRNAYEAVLAEFAHLLVPGTAA